jgi:hypothetical protein
MTATPGSRDPAEARPLTYAAASDVSVPAARERYDELTGRDFCARAAARLRARGEFDPDKLGHRLIDEAEPLTTEDHLELMALGEALARYYRHPVMLDHAAKAGATWEQIGAARGTSADQARRDYQEWAKGQHDLLTCTGGRFGMNDTEYAAALARSADPGASAGTGRPAVPHGDRARAGDRQQRCGLEAGQ